MTDKDLKRLSRTELLELLVQISDENDKLKEQISSLEKQLEDRTITIKNSGSIAEAALNLTSIFAEAQQAADVYLENICRQEAAAESQTMEKLRVAERYCVHIRHKAERECDKMLKDTEEACRRMRAQAVAPAQDATSAATEAGAAPEQDIQEASDSQPALETIPEEAPRRKLFRK